MMQYTLVRDSSVTCPANTWDSTTVYDSNVVYEWYEPEPSLEELLRRRAESIALHARDMRLFWPSFKEIQKSIPNIIRQVARYLRTGRRTRESRAQREVRQLARAWAV